MTLSLLLIAIIICTSASTYWQRQPEPPAPASPAHHANAALTAQPAPLPLTNQRLAKHRNSQNARWLDTRHPDLAALITALPWVQDGITPSETDTVDYLIYTAIKNHNALRETLAQPFLHDSHTRNDLLLVKAIHAAVYAGVYHHISQSPPWQQHQIDGNAAPLAIAALATQEPAYLEHSSVQQHHASTTRNPDLTLAIIRPPKHPATDADEPIAILALQAIAAVEDAMQAPLPVPQVIILFDRRAVIDGNAINGNNLNHAIALLPETKRYPTEALFNLLTHELAHYWWHDNAAWLNEGLADIIAATASASQHHSEHAKPNLRQHCQALNLSSIPVNAHATSGSNQFHCNYFLGERLFRALQQATPPEQFQAAIHRLLGITRELKAHDPNFKPGIEAVRQAFPQQHAIIEHHWSGNLNPPDTWDPDDQLNFQNHDVISWQLKPTLDPDGYVSFTGALLNPATLAQPNVNTTPAPVPVANFSINNPDGVYLGGIHPPQPDDQQWVLTDPYDVVAERYAISDNQFDIRFPWPPDRPHHDLHITVWGFSNPSRQPSISPTADPLGQSRIRAASNHQP